MSRPIELVRHRDFGGVDDLTVSYESLDLTGAAGQTLCVDTAEPNTLVRR